MEEAHEIMVESLQILAEHALKYHMSLAIENHVLAPFSLMNGKNRLLLGVTAQELLKIVAEVGGDNIGILIDVGHLKVSANTLGFSPYEFIKILSPNTIAVHLSDNNGDFDEHRVIRGDSWFWEPLRDLFSNDIPCVLEASSCSVVQIAEQLELTRLHMKLKKRNVG